MESETESSIQRAAMLSRAARPASAGAVSTSGRGPLRGPRSLPAWVGAGWCKARALSPGMRPNGMYFTTTVLKVLNGPIERKYFSYTYVT